jgi:carbon starvation protein
MATTIAPRLPKPLSFGIWALVVALGTVALYAIAFTRGESIDAMWFIVAAVCVYALGYRFYSAFLAAKVFALDVTRATPAERFSDGRDFVPTNRWIVFGHHFAAIAGPGPLIGPTLAAQFGYLPGPVDQWPCSAAAQISWRCSARFAATAGPSVRWHATSSARSAARSR